MAYIGRGLDNGVRNQFVFAATQGQTSFSGADSDGKTLAMTDILYTDCYQNGVKLKPTTDYTVSSTTLTLISAASLNDVINIVSFDIFAVPDTVPASTGGTFGGGIAAAGYSSSTAGTSNYIAGVNAGNSITAGGNYNVTVGDEAGTAITTGDSNTAVGFEALATEDTASRNTAIGFRSLKTNNGGDNNTAVGENSGTAVTTGHNNTLIGQDAGEALTDADYNTALGSDALQSDTLGSKSTAVGAAALSTQNFTSATDSHNTAVGYEAGKAVTTGQYNTLVGSLTGDAMTTGENNVAMGQDALTTNVAGDNVVAIGNEAAQLLNPSGNVDMNGVYIGYQAGDEVTTGRHNTVIGALTANALTTGSNNLLLGTTAGNADQPGGSISTGGGQIVLGNASSTNAHIQIDWTVASDERDKTDFTALDLGLDFVKELEPVTYKWDKRAKYGNDISTITHDGTHKEDWLDVGFKAQAVEVLEKAAGYKIADKTNLTTSLTDDGKQYGLQYSKFVPILVKALQELSEKNDALESRLAALEAE